MREELQEVELLELREPLPYQFSVNRRQFLEIAGSGLLIFALAPAADAQRESGGGTLEARLHLGEDGRITILTGKIEEGQGPRTELAMAAAEELRAPLAQIAMMMADTDVTPNDGTTAGSRSTPSTVPLVRRAAAAARELLIATAAQRWNVPRERIRLAAGSASVAGSADKLTYGDLARSPDLAGPDSDAARAGLLQRADELRQQTSP